MKEKEKLNPFLIALVIIFAPFVGFYQMISYLIKSDEKITFKQLWNIWSEYVTYVIFWFIGLLLVTGLILASYTIIMSFGELLVVIIQYLLILMIMIIGIPMIMYYIYGFFKK